MVVGLLPGLEVGVVVDVADVLNSAFPRCAVLGQVAGDTAASSGSPVFRPAEGWTPVTCQNPIFSSVLLESTPDGRVGSDPTSAPVGGGMDRYGGRARAVRRNGCVQA